MMILYNINVFLKDEFEYFIYYLKQKIRQATKLNGFFAISIVSML